MLHNLSGGLGVILRKKPENTLNDLDGKEWIKATKSWFIINPRQRSSEQLDHPAKYPEELVKHLVGFFSKKGSWILDPFAGVGSTQIACKETDRNSVGIELNPDFIETGRRYLASMKGDTQQYLILGDAKEAPSLIENQFKGKAPEFDFNPVTLCKHGGGEKYYGK